MMVVIADEERRHAELAWAIDTWARTRLSTAEVAELDAAIAEAKATGASDAAVAKITHVRDEMRAALGK